MFHYSIYILYKVVLNLFKVAFLSTILKILTLFIIGILFK